MAFADTEADNRFTEQPLEATKHALELFKAAAVLAFSSQCAAFFLSFPWIVLCQPPGNFTSFVMFSASAEDVGTLQVEMFMP